MLLLCAYKYKMLFAWKVYVLNKDKHKKVQ